MLSQAHHGTGEPAVRCDYHIHTRYLGCGNATMEVAAIAARCEGLGLGSIAITDHVNRMEDIPKHQAIAQDIKQLETTVGVHFGVELNFMGADGNFAYSEQIRDELGFQFAIGGVHETYLDGYDLERLVAVQHRHHLRTCADPLVAVLVHPWWFGRGEFETKGYPWFCDLAAVPGSLMRELADAAVGTQTAIEVNATAILVNPHYGPRFQAQYRDFLSLLNERGVHFSLGSDAHDINALDHIQAAQQLVRDIGIPLERVWHPSAPPVNVPRSPSR